MRARTIVSKLVSIVLFSLLSLSLIVSKSVYAEYYVVFSPNCDACNKTVYRASSHHKKYHRIKHHKSPRHVPSHYRHKSCEISVYYIWNDSWSSNSPCPCCTEWTPVVERHVVQSRKTFCPHEEYGYETFQRSDDNYDWDRRTGDDVGSELYSE